MKNFLFCLVLICGGLTLFNIYKGDLEMAKFTALMMALNYVNFWSRGKAEELLKKIKEEKGE